MDPLTYIATDTLVPVPAVIMADIEELRDLNLFNMLDGYTAVNVFYALGSDATAAWIRQNVGLYVAAIMCGMVVDGADGQELHYDRH